MKIMVCDFQWWCR